MNSDLPLTLISTTRKAEELAAHAAGEVAEAFLALTRADLTLLAKRRTCTVYGHAVTLTQQAISGLTHSNGASQSIALMRAHLATFEALRDGAEQATRELERHLDVLKAQLSAAQNRFTSSSDMTSRECAAALAQLRDAHAAASPARDSSTVTTKGSPPVADDWSDLQPFHGSQPSFSRACKMCGNPLSNGRRRFCSRDCHDLYREAFPGPLGESRD